MTIFEAPHGSKMSLVTNQVPITKLAVLVENFFYYPHPNTVWNSYSFFLFLRPLSVWIRMDWSWSTPCPLLKVDSCFLAFCWRQGWWLKGIGRRLSEIHVGFTRTALIFNEDLGFSFKILTVRQLFPNDFFVVLGTKIYKFTFVRKHLFYEGWRLGGYLPLKYEEAICAVASILEDDLIFFRNNRLHRLK